ncbi:MAG: hypothetical protein LC751_10530 [Actinobacteria bacterium]|nr:hypothetical protein [Actinomycetota bacterium]
MILIYVAGGGGMVRKTLPASNVAPRALRRILVALRELLVRALAPLLLRRRFSNTVSLIYPHSFVSSEQGIDEIATS